MTENSLFGPFGPIFLFSSNACGVIIKHMKILMCDNSILICVKPAGVLSTDEPGGVPSLAREALGDPSAELRTVHRLDQVVGGVMVLARSKAAAAELGRQVMSRRFEKEYLAVVHGRPEPACGRMTDLLARNKAERKTYVVDVPGKGVQEAVLDYTVLGEAAGMSLVRVVLRTGRTHQIRCQFASRSLPLVGERKYSTLPDNCELALWSCRAAFDHPDTGERMDVRLLPPAHWPWTEFDPVTTETECNDGE